MKLLQLYRLRLSLQDETNIQLVGASSRASHSHTAPYLYL